LLLRAGDRPPPAPRRLRSFAADETGASSFEYFLIAAFCSAAAVVVLETMGFSLLDALGGRKRN
jgi:Flp pilus assembly pilin Flp